MNRPYSHEEIARLTEQAFGALKGQPLMLVHAVALNALLSTLMEMHDAEPLVEDLVALRVLVEKCGAAAFRLLAEGPYDGLPVA